MANFLLVMPKDDNMAATRCFQLARITHSKGHNVNLFLMDDAVKLADSPGTSIQFLIEGQT